MIAAVPASATVPALLAVSSASVMAAVPVTPELAGRIATMMPAAWPVPDIVNVFDPLAPAAAWAASATPMSSVVVVRLVIPDGAVQLVPPEPKLAASATSMAPSVTVVMLGATAELLRLPLATVVGVASSGVPVSAPE